MKKLIILIVILAFMGCSDDSSSNITRPHRNTSTESEADTTTVNESLECSQPLGESCDFLQAWDSYTCECEWIF